MEETNELRAQALIDSVVLLLLGHGCITVKEAEWVLDLTPKEDTLTAKELRNLILGLEDKARSCDKNAVALAAAKLLREALKELNG